MRRWRSEKDAMKIESQKTAVSRSQDEIDRGEYRGLQQGHSYVSRVGEQPTKSDLDLVPAPGSSRVDTSTPPKSTSPGILEMQSNSKGTSQVEDRPYASYNISTSAACSEPWWRSAGYSSIPASVVVGNSKDDQARADGELNDENDDGNHGQAQQNFQHQTSASNDNLSQPPQLELVGHTIACTSTPYQYPYYGGMMAPFGPQPLVPAQVLDMHHARMPLPIDMEQQPVYVNAKQYHGILRRRQSRAKAELEKKLIKARKPYLHESRHQHAIRRARVSGGRFAKKTDADALKSTTETGSGSASSGSEPLPRKTGETWNTHSEHEINETGNNTRRNGTNNDQYHDHSSYPASRYGGHSGNGDEGDSRSQQWEHMSSNKGSQRALAI